MKIGKKQEKNQPENRDENYKNMTNNSNISDLDLYKIIRDYMTHEDSLINNRLTWLLAIQGLLFTAYGLSIREAHPTENLTSLILILKILGMSTSIFSFVGILAALLAIHQLKNKWEERDNKSQLPEIIGGGNLFAHVMGGHTPIAIPSLFFVAWFSLLDWRQDFCSMIVFFVVMLLYLVIASCPIWGKKYK